MYLVLIETNQPIDLQNPVCTFKTNTGVTYALTLDSFFVNEVVLDRQRNGVVSLIGVGRELAGLITAKDHDKVLGMMRAGYGFKQLGSRSVSVVEVDGYQKFKRLVYKAAGSTLATTS